MWAPLQISQSATLLTPPPSTLSYLYRGVHFLGSLSFSVRYDVMVKDSSSVEITGTGQSWCLLWAPFPPCLSYSLPKETHSFRLSARVFSIAFGLCQWDIFVGNQIIRQIAQTICSVILRSLRQQFGSAFSPLPKTPASVAYGSSSDPLQVSLWFSERSSFVPEVFRGYGSHCS